MLEILGTVDTQVGALREVLPQEPVDASMSSGGLVPCDGVLPGSVIGGHRPVNGIDEVALKDSSRTAGTLVGFVSGQ